MEITTRSLWTLLHGMGFGALFLLACSGALVGLYFCFSADQGEAFSERHNRFFKGYLIVMTVLAWATVLTGAYVIYPWYRAAPAAGVADLAGFPQRLLLSNPATREWHSIGMEWKEHVAWLAPISITMATAVFMKYGRAIRNHPQMRTALLCFVSISFLAAGVAGFFGAMIDKHAPVEGGPVLGIFHGE